MKNKFLHKNFLRFLFVFFFSLSASLAFAQPPNDEPCDAIDLAYALTCNYQTYNTVGATPSVGMPAPGCASYQGGDIWFTTIVPCTGSLTIDTRNIDITDGGMAIYTGDCSNLTLVSCNDDSSPNGLMPMITQHGLNPGDKVYIRFWEFGNNVFGDFEICVTQIAGPATGSDCSTSSPFCTSTIYSFPNSTNQPSLGGGGIYGCLLSTPNPVWYYMQIQNSGPMTINISQTNTSGTGIDVDFVLWGPFANQVAGCSNISASNIVDCSYSPAPQETAAIPNAQAGEFYILLITNFNGSAGTITFQQTGGTASTNCNIICTVTAGNSGPVCVGGTVDLTSSISGATYTWEGPDCWTSTVQNPTNVPVPTMPGSYDYTVTVLNADGSVCVATTTVVVGNLSGTSAVVPTTCVGVNNGEITVTPSTAGVYTYTLNPGNVVQNNNAVFSGLAAGTYNITFVNANGCQGSVNNIVVQQGAGLTATAAVVGTSCAGASNGEITITPSTGGTFTYTLNPGNIIQAGNAQFSGLAAGTYNVSFVDNTTGCAGSLTDIVVTPGAALTGTATPTATTCAGVPNGEILVNPTLASVYTYTLNPGNIVQANNPNFTGLAPGTYSVTFTENATGCQGQIDNIIITEGANLTAQATAIATSCPTVSNGSITVQHDPGSGTAPFQYSINGGPLQASNTFTNLAVGTHTIVFTDAIGCTGTVSATVTPGAEISSTLQIVNPPCAGIADGTLTINPGSGTAPYQYSLNGGPAQAGNVFTGLAPGTYSISITDAIGCTGTNTATLTTNTALNFDRLTLTMPLCNAGSDGIAEAVISGGVGPYTYAMNGGIGQSSNIFNTMSAGTYTIEITDNVGCFMDSTFTMAEPTLLSSVAVGTGDAGCGNNDGVITVTGNNGTPPYQYSISGPSTNTSGLTTGVFNNLIGGAYTVTTTDANGCTYTTTTNINFIDNMFLTLDDEVTVCEESSVSFQPQTNPETNTFTWTSLDAPLSTIANPAIKNAVITTPDTARYVLHAQWGNCERFDTILVNVLHKPMAHAGLDTAICDISYATLIGASSHTSGSVNYSWSPAEHIVNPQAQTTDVYPPGNNQTYVYTLTVTDNYGCGFSVTDEVGVRVQPPVPAFAGIDTHAVKSIPHQLNAVGGQDYLWQPGSMVSDPMIHNPTTTLEQDQLFVVRVTDFAGCIGYDTIFVKVYEGPTYYIPNAFTPNGDGLNDIFRPVPVGIVHTEYFRVFNRYGQLMYETRQWMRGWDGRFKGKMQPLGAYIWIIKGLDRDGKSVEMKGTVMLIE